MEKLRMGVFLLSADLGTTAPNMQHSSSSLSRALHAGVCSPSSPSHRNFWEVPCSWYRLGRLPAVLADPSPYGKLPGIPVSLAL